MPKITSIDVFKMDVDKAYVVKIALGSASKVENVLIRLNTDAGISGWGEGSPFSMITGETIGSALEASKFLGKALIGKEATAIEENNTLMKRLLPTHPSVRCAIDLAMWDILGKESQMPVYRLLGGKKVPIENGYDNWP